MKKQQLAIREQALLSAALDCFATEGCEDVTVARIAKLAGVAKGTVYLHFTSKDEICARLAQVFYDTLDLQYDGVSGNGRTQLAQLVEISFRHYREFKHYRHIVQYCQREHFLQNINADISQSLQSSGIMRRQRIAKVLELGANDQSLASNNTAKLTAICCTIDGALYNFHLNAHWDQNIQMEFIDTVSHYIISSVDRQRSMAPTTDKPDTSPELISEVY